MSQMNKIRMSCLLLIAGLLPLAGCGTSTPNPVATFISTTALQNTADKQPAGHTTAAWLPGGHAAMAQRDQSICAPCHGNDFLGGISRVSCTQCHIGGASSRHPQDWIQGQVKDWSKHGAYVAGIGNDTCANAACHGKDLAGVAESGPSCTSCHLGSAVSMHPKEWGKNAAALHGEYTLNNGGGKCANAACHGTDLGGTVKSGPPCTKCHAIPPHNVAEERAAACVSCHDRNTTSKLQHRWAAPTFVNHKSFLTANGNDTSSCAISACHGKTLSGGNNSPSCTSCHMGGVSSVHPVEWGSAIVQKHPDYVKLNSTQSCAKTACHGPNLSGAGNAPACSFCHTYGETWVHPVDFGGAAALNHSAYLAARGNDVSTCANAGCHGAGLSGMGNAPSCATKCHLGGAMSKHPASFGTTARQADLNHKAFIELNTGNGSDGMAGCRNGYCHGSSLTGAGRAPACSTTQCHQVGSPDKPSLTPCASCHGMPPTGAAAPNRGGAHAKHNALAGVTNVCNTCHSGAGTGTTNHFNGAVEVQVLSAYNAKSGTATRNADGTCSKVSCHGGQTTPAWLTGSINMSTQCTLCHSYGTDEYNGFASGQVPGGHDFHVNTQRFGCTICHVATQLPASSHFPSLTAATIDRSAAIASLNSGLSYTNYSVSGHTYGSCSPSCHVQRNW